MVLLEKIKSTDWQLHPVIIAQGRTKWKKGGRFSRMGINQLQHSLHPSYHTLTTDSKHHTSELFKVSRVPILAENDKLIYSKKEDHLSISSQALAKYIDNLT